MNQPKLDAALQERNPDTTVVYEVNRWRNGVVSQVDDCIAEEVPVAMIYNGISHAVMLATPDDLEDFALGFSLSETILGDPSELYGIEVVSQENGIELQMEIATERFVQLKERRRSIAGRTGCGLCGAESLEQALRIPKRVVTSNSRIMQQAIHRAQQAIQSGQKLQALTGATHASAWVSLEGDVLMVREDVGRHNALDKLIGARARQQLVGQTASGYQQEAGFVITTSRASYEMVQKVVTADIPMLVAISAPTGLAVRIAQECGITLVGFTRAEQHVVYSHPERIGYEGN